MGGLNTTTLCLYASTNVIGTNSNHQLATCSHCIHLFLALATEIYVTLDMDSLFIALRKVLSTFYSLLYVKAQSQQLIHGLFIHCFT